MYLIICKCQFIKVCLATFLGSSKHSTGHRVVMLKIPFVVKVAENYVNGAPCCHEEDLSLSWCGDGCFNLCTLISQYATVVQPHPAPGPNLTCPG